MPPGILAALQMEGSAVPRVTVLMTLYNKGAFVQEAVRSVLNGSYADLELLVVDDGSTDEGPGHVSAIGDPRIRLLRAQRNGGRAGAANRGYDAARGEFIAVLDADDRMHPERIARQVAFLDANPEVGAVGSALSAFGEKEGKWSWPATNEEAQGKLLFGDPVCYGTAMIRRAIIEQHHVRCEEDWHFPGMDFLFLVALAPHLGFANLPEALTHYRIGDQNMRHGRDPLEDRERILRRQFEQHGIPASDEEVRLHLILHRLFRRVPEAEDMVALASWIERLKALNRAKVLFPATVFESELDRRYRGLYHMLADHSFAAAIAHARHGAGMGFGNLRYLATMTLRRLFGWRPTDPSTHPRKHAEAAVVREQFEPSQP